jgi:AbrB family looped-hinge helix DNA binding protein
MKPQQEHSAMPLVRVKEKYQVTIPASIRKELHLEQGSILEAVIENGVIVLKPKVVVDPDHAEVEEGMEDLRAGRVTEAFSSVEEFKSSLK